MAWMVQLPEQQGREPRFEVSLGVELAMQLT